MIVEMICDIFFGLAHLVLTFLPAITIPVDLLGSVSAIVELLSAVSFFMPMGILTMCIIVWIATNNVQAMKGTIDWILRKIPGVG